jgi:radical SAM protein with 4Fe4S-binding SPASM domain
VLNGLRQLIRQRDITRSKLRIHVGTVLQAGNVSEFIELVELGDELGVDRINARPVEDYGSVEDKPFALKDYMGELERSVAQYLEERDRLLVDVDIRPLVVFLNRNKTAAPARRERPCLVPWYSTYVTWEGDVYPCCYYYDGQVSFGSVFDAPFGEIWNSRQYREFRTTLRDDRDSLPICRSCKREERLLEF